MRKLFLIPLLFLSLFSFGQIDSLFTVVGTHEWVVPNSVTSIEVFAVQGGQGSGRENGGDGGETAGVTSLMVVPGETLYITVGDGGDRNSFGATGTDGDHSSIMRGMAIIFSSNGTGSDSHHLGGDGGSFQIISTPCGGLVGGAGGGGAGGYTGNGGDGGGGGGTTGLAGAGGAGGGGGGALTYSTVFGSYVLYGFRGGGVGILGEGASGGSSTGIGNDGSGGNFGYGGFGISNTKTIVGCFNSSVATADNGGQGALRITYTTGIVPEQKPIPPTWHSNTAMAMMMGIIANFSQPVDLLTGLVSVWEMDRTTVGDAIDAHGSNDLTNSTADIDSIGILDRAYSYNGTSSYLYHPTLFDVMPSALTLSAWVYSKDLSTVNAIFGKNNIIGQDRFYFDISSTAVRFIYEQNNSGIQTIPASITPAEDTWYNLVVTWGTAGIKIYINGELDTTSSSHTALPKNGTATNFKVGTWSDSDIFAQGFKGKIDQFGYWNTEKTLEQIQGLYNSGNGIFYINWH